MAGDVIDKFTKVAVSKLKVSSKEQVRQIVSIDHIVFMYFVC